MTISYATIFFSSFIIALSGALMPGPMLTVTLSESVRRGAMAGPLMILGHGILELFLILALLSGFAAFLHRDDVFIVISILGGTTLFWMAVMMLRGLNHLSIDLNTETERKGNLIVAGILLSLVNPYWFIWWASIGMGYIVNAMAYGFAGVVAFFSGHILADLAWYGLVSLAVARGRSLLTDSVYRKLIGGCAICLMLFSCYFFYSGLDKLV